MSIIIADCRWQTSTLHIDIRAPPPVLSTSLWIIKLMSKFSCFVWHLHQCNWNCIFVGTTNSKPPGPISMIDQSKKLSRSQVQLITLCFGGAQLRWAFYQPRQVARIWCKKTNFLSWSDTFWVFHNKFYCLDSHTEHRWRWSKAAHCIMEFAKYKSLCMMRCLWQIYMSPGRWVEISERVVKWAEWPGSGTFQYIMVFIVWWALWICRMIMWIWHNGHMDSEQWLGQEEPLHCV
jgi:hypothetical protein